MRALVALLVLAVTPAAFGAVSQVGTRGEFLTSSGSYTAGAGTNRLVVMQSCRKPTSTGVTPTVTAANLGANSLANGKLIQAQVSNRTASNRNTCYLWYIKEADIESGAQTAGVTWSTTMDGTSSGVIIYTLQGVNQTTPIDTSTGGTGLNVTSSNPWSGSIAVADGSFQILIAGANANLTSAPEGTWTEESDATFGQTARVISHSRVTATAATVNWSITYSGSNDGTVAVVSFAPAAASPEFDVNPTVSSQTDTAYTIGGSTDGAVTVYAVACIKDSAAPSIAEVSAGDCDGSVDAEAAVNESWNGSNNFVLGGSLINPLYDLYVTDGTNLITLADEALDAPTGKQYVTLASVSATSWCADFNAVATPDIAAGDIIKIDLVTDPDGFAWTQGTDCDGSYSGTSARQSLEYDIYDTSVGAYMAGGPGTLWFNDPGITCSGTLDLLLDVGVAMDTLDLDTFCDHPSGDALSYAVTTGTLPTVLSLNGANGEITGTPETEDEGGVAVQVTATSTVSGATATQDIRFFPIDTITVPDCDGLEVGPCAALIEDSFLEATAGFECSDSVDPGLVFGQDPAANSEVEPGTTVTLDVARACGGGTGRWLDLRLQLTPKLKLH